MIPPYFIFFPTSQSQSLAAERERSLLRKWGHIVHHCANVHLLSARYPVRPLELCQVWLCVHLHNCLRNWGPGKLLQLFYEHLSLSYRIYLQETTQSHSYLGSSFSLMLSPFQHTAAQSSLLAPVKIWYPVLGGRARVAQGAPCLN